MVLKARSGSNQRHFTALHHVLIYMCIVHNLNYSTVCCMGWPGEVPKKPCVRLDHKVRLQVRDWGSPNSDDWRKSLALCLLCWLDPLRVRAHHKKTSLRDAANSYVKVILKKHRFSDCFLGVIFSFLRAIHPFNWTSYYSSIRTRYIDLIKAFSNLYAYILLTHGKHKIYFFQLLKCFLLLFHRTS